MTPEDHALLSHTEPNTAMGNLIRRYWVPAVLSSELQTDGAPVRVKLLSEPLIAFRGADGKPGLLGEHCAHRGASLYLANNRNCRLQCWYHGWTYDADGNCVDTPNEPPDINFKSRIKQKAYPCVERAGVVWAYMGPPDKTPPMPGLEWLTVPDSHVYASKRHQLCAWTQGMEGDLDSSHLAFLHGETIHRTAEHAGFPSAAWMANDLNPKIEVVSTQAGIMLGARRNATPETYYWRVAQWFAPGFTTIPAFTGDGPMSGHSWTSADNESCWVFTFTWHPTRPLTSEEVTRMRAGSAVHSALVPGTATPIANKSNGYAGPDAPPAQQPWMRIKNFQDQDNAITESMGGLFDRTQEHLGASDIAIIQMRRRLVTAARRLAAGHEPPGMNAADYRLRPHSAELPRSVAAWPEAIADAIDARPETFRASM